MYNYARFTRSPRSHLFRTTLALFTFLPFLLAGSLVAHAADVMLAWDANADPVAGYRLYYGHASRSYQNSVDVGKVTSYTWTGLAEGKTYYFAVTAYNSNNVESSYSAELVCHTVTASSGGGGSISPSGTVFVTAGTSQTYTSSPSTGYTVGNMTVDGVSQGPITSYTFTNVAAPHNISASFALKTYTITAGVSGAGGTISPSGAQNVSHGGSLSFSIAPGTGYNVGDVVVDGVSKGAVTSYAFTNVTAGHTITASFVPKTYTITAGVSGSGGTISPSGAQNVSHGGSLSFSIAPGTGYNVGDVVVDGVSKGALTSYAFTNVTAGHTITASFVPKTYTITAGVSGSGGTISPSGAQNVSHGGSLSFSIAPGTGYNVGDVVVDGVSKGALTSYAFTNVAAPHSITASFKASNLPPHADAGPDQTVDEGILVTLLGSNSRDPEGSVLSHLWEQVDGPAVQLSSTTTADPTFRAPDVGPEGLALTFRLTVTDDLGARSSDTCIVNVTWVNIPPTADAGADQAVNMGAIVTLDGSGSTDVDDGIASYSWKRVSGPVVETVDWSQPTITFVAPDVASEGASLVFELTVTDHNGLKATDSCIVNVSWVNTPPTSNAGPDQAAYEADTVMLDGSASTDDEGIVSYQWKQTLGTPVALSDPNAPSVQFIAPTISAASETLTFTLAVTDAGTLQSEDTCQVTVHKKSGVDLTGGWKSSTYDGSKFVGTVQVKNAGNLRAGTFRVALYLSSNGTALTRLLKTTTVYGLSAGAAKDLSYSYRARGLSGQSMIAVIDSTGVIQETNEANNRAVVAIK